MEVENMEAEIRTPESEVHLEIQPRRCHDPHDPEKKEIYCSVEAAYCDHFWPDKGDNINQKITIFT